MWPVLLTESLQVCLYADGVSTNFRAIVYCINVGIPCTTGELVPCITGEVKWEAEVRPYEDDGIKVESKLWNI